jgi:hypothetical protein
MKNIILVIAIVAISFTGVAQRKLVAGTTRSLPKMENQITTKDSLSDEFGLEYFEREFQGEEEDTAALNKDFREREAFKKGKITDPEREVIEIDYEKIYFMDMKDLEETKKEDVVKPKSVVVKPKK